MLKVYGDYRSGNCYKIKLMLHLLDQPYEWIAINILRGETRSEQFLKKNPNGKIPVLELEDGSCLWESNAILNYLADGSEFLPTDPRLRTQVLQWQFFEQYSHEPFIAVARYIKSHVNTWLRQHPQVLGFTSCLPRHGGTGALYVVLKRTMLEGRDE